MQRPKPLWIANILLIILCSVASAQELQLTSDPPFRLYSVAEGLNQKTVLAIAQDHDGYLWIATFGGLNRFDGKTFESFTTRQGLRRNMIQALMVDSQNRLWAGDSAGGLTLIEDGRVIRTFDPQKNSQGVVRSILEQGDTLYLGLQPGGLRALSLKDLDRGIEIVSDSPETVFSIVAAGPDELYTYTSRGLEHYDPQHNTFELLVEDVRALYGRKGASPIIGHEDGRVGQIVDDQVVWWPENYGGPVTGVTFDDDSSIKWVHVNEQSLHAFGNPDLQLVSAGTSVSALIDQEGVLWVPMRKGLARYLGNRFTHYGLETDEYRPEVFAIHPGAEGNFWFGTSQGLLHADAEGTLTNVSRQLGIAEKEVRGVALSEDGSTLWVVHIEELAYRIDTATLDATPFLGDEPLYGVGLALDPKGRVWVGSYSGTLYGHDPVSGDTREIAMGQGAAIYAMDLAPDGWLWFGAAYRGLYRLDTRDPEAEPELVKSVDDIGREFFTQIVVDPYATERTVWIASVEGGVFRLTNDALERFEIDEALGDFTVYSLHPLSDGTLVIATSRGAYRYDIESGHLEHYSALDGFVSIEAKAHATYFDGADTLWIGTTSGVTAMNLAAPMTTVPSPRPLLSRRLVDGEVVSANAATPTEVARGNVLVEYAAISTRRPDGIEYSYRLSPNGVEGAWSETTTTQSIGYSNLPPGPYAFAVRARLPGREWSEQARWNFVVPTPYWRTTWFITIATLGALLLAWTAVQLRLRVIAGANKRLRREVADRTASIEAGRRELELANQQLSSEIQERQRADALRADVEARFHQAYQNSPIGMALVDTEGLVYDANPPLKALFWPNADTQDRQPLLSVVTPDDRDGFAAFLDALANEEDVGTSMEVDCVAHNGEVRRISFLPSPVRNPLGELQYLVMLAQDVTESRAMTSKLEYQASFDELTGLLNRRAFTERLAQVDTQQDNAFLLFLDLDQFKVVNDTCGHAAGDELLRTVAKRIRECVRKRDTIARLGGDEFALIVGDCTVDMAVRRAETIREAIQELEFVWETDIFRIGVSVGIVPIGEATDDLNELQQLADAACYAAKEAGRNRVHLVRGTDDAVHEHRGEMRWVQRLNHAIDTDSFVLFGQRIQPVGEHSPPGERIEILLRMLDRESGRLIPPGAFLPAAERYSLQARLDEWVVSRVIDLLAVQDASEVASRQFWVNLSGASVGDGTFSKTLIDKMRSANLPAGCINFEITETAVVRKIDDAAQLIAALKAMGSRFALDDFGTGLSSFGYLKRLDVDYLKVDGLFVRDIVSDLTDRVFVKSIIDIAHTLNLGVVCEFVEDDAILEMVRELGSDYAQGYGVHRPQPLDELLGAGRPAGLSGLMQQG